MALTKVSGGILDPGINVAGIVTATGFDGPFIGGSGKNIVAGIVTCTELDLNGSGNISGNLVVEGNLTANGDFTTLNTTLREVELLRVDAQDNSVAAGIITQRGTGNILELYDTSTNVLTVKDGGKIGIGTDTPSHLLHLQSASSPSIKLEDTTNTCILLSYAQNTNAHVGTYSDHDLIFDTDSTEKLRIRSDGNVNIVKDLNVTGIVTATSFSGVGAFVSGMIILWSGAADAIPSGFVLCDGNNSTPNLTDRFIVGAGSGYAVNATGGSADATLPSHYHNYPGDDQLTAANGKSGGTQFGTTPTWSNTFDDSFNYDATSTLTGGAKLWRTTTVGESVTNKNLPPYYALCYIMKT